MSGRSTGSRPGFPRYARSEPEAADPDEIARCLGHVGQAAMSGILFELVAQCREDTRLPGLPAWGLPMLGGAVLASVAVAWVTSALWFFTRSGLPLL